MNGNSSDPQLEPTPGGAATFSTTHWSVVLDAGTVDSPRAEEALEKLCRTYWHPLYVFIRRKGHSPLDAQDLTQEFFARLLEKGSIALADQARGKFRTFLLGSLENFLVNEWNKATAAKRGGRHQIISWDESDAENRYLQDAADGTAPDKLFEKRWANRLLEEVRENLKKEFRESGKSELFDALIFTLSGEPTESSYAEIGSRFGMAEGAVKVAVHRLRARYRELLRAEVANTVATAAEVDEELRYLASVLRT